MLIRHFRVCVTEGDEDMGKRTIAYVGSYTYIGESQGITIFDVDEEKGLFVKRKEVSVNNSSYMVLSNSKKFLYSLADEGIVAFRILEDGDLEYVNTANIRGMRTTRTPARNLQSRSGSRRRYFTAAAIPSM